MASLDNGQVSGLYGMEPKMEAIARFRIEMYRRIELEVRRWIAEQRFLLRFSIGSMLFAVSYLMLSIVIRDPLPVIDEIAISLGVAISAFILLRRRDYRSAAFANRRKQLCASIDAVKFHATPFITTIEECLRRCEGLNLRGRLHCLQSDERLQLIDDREKIVEWLSSLPNNFQRGRWRRHERRLFKHWDDDELPLPKGKILTFDVPLFFIGTILRRRLKELSE